MGYRHYMYKISKELVNEIKSMNYDELSKKFELTGEEGYFYIGNLPKEEIWEFGKLYWDDTADRIYSKGYPLFEKEEVMNELSDYVPYIVGKEGLEEAIEIYKNKVISMYENLLIDDKNGTASVKQKQHIKNNLSEWTRGWALNTDVNDSCLSHSWKYEYSIFELTRLLKTIDFETETILFYGW
ncbi:hypothetical protein MOB34_05455 [Bacillus spizizenii]|nr:hypothetical protein [Bacillus spizizenii]MCY8229607.1 hypothetical protein [Bacillus spizizenii]MCY8888094.1 hypothetical protein [Bacillus spizizenii]MEC0840238.1 hypothetical protein [Bacillus spizizenii]